MSRSYGFIETQGLIGSIEAADAMLKAAKVKLVQKREIGFGLVTVVVEGELGAVQASVDAGRVAAERVGEFISAHVIARPFADTEKLVIDDLRGEQTSLSVPQKNEARVKSVPAVQPKIESKKEEKTVSKKAAAVKRKPKKKSVTPKAEQKPQQEEKTTQVLNYLKQNKKGATLQELAEHIKEATVQTRILLKQLLDQNKIEKVQQRYYTLD